MDRGAGRARGVVRAQKRPCFCESCSQPHRAVLRIRCGIRRRAPVPPFLPPIILWDHTKKIGMGCAEARRDFAAGSVPWFTNFDGTSAAIAQSRAPIRPPGRSVLLPPAQVLRTFRTHARALPAVAHGDGEWIISRTSCSARQPRSRQRRQGEQRGWGPRPRRDRLSPFRFR